MYWATYFSKLRLIWLGVEVAHCTCTPASLAILWGFSAWQCFMRITIIIESLSRHDENTNDPPCRFLSGMSCPLTGCLETYRRHSAVSQHSHAAARPRLRERRRLPLQVAREQCGDEWSSPLPAHPLR